MLEENTTNELLENYTAEKSVQIEEENLKSVGKSIENERIKAGILVGFYFLILIQLYPLFEPLNLYLKGVITVLVLFITYLLIDCFCSEKINEGVQVGDNFDNNWKNKKDFLKKYFKIINGNKEKQKTLLSKLSRNIKLSMILLSLVIFLILIFNSFNFMCEEENNPMKPDMQELGEQIEDTSIPQEDNNPMKPDTIEKGE